MKRNQLNYTRKRNGKCRKYSNKTDLEYPFLLKSTRTDGQKVHFNCTQWPFSTFIFCIDPHPPLLETQHSSDFLNSNHYTRNTVAGEVIRECIDYSQHDSTLIRGRNCTNERGRLDRSIIIFLTSNIYSQRHQKQSDTCSVI